MWPPGRHGSAGLALLSMFSNSKRFSCVTLAWQLPMSCDKNTYCAETAFEDVVFGQPNAVEKQRRMMIRLSDRDVSWPANKPRNHSNGATPQLNHTLLTPRSQPGLASWKTVDLKLTPRTEGSLSDRGVSGFYPRPSFCFPFICAHLSPQMGATHLPTGYHSTFSPGHLHIANAKGHGRATLYNSSSHKLRWSTGLHVWSQSCALRLQTIPVHM